MRVSLEVTDWGPLVDRLARHASSPLPLLLAAGGFVRGRSRATFVTQGRPPGSWLPRMNPNLPGIIKDLTYGTNVKNERFEDSPALTDTGVLKLSLAAEPTGKDEVTVGVFNRDAAEYAGKHQFGAKDVPSLPITPTVKENAARWLKTEGDTARAKAVRQLVGHDDGDVLLLNISPRPFLVYDDADAQDLNEILAELWQQSDDPEADTGGE